MSAEEQLARLIPSLTRDRYSVTSPSTSDYNCIAWAAEDDARWWWPLPVAGGGNYWPASVPRECTLARFQEAFALLGYRISADAGLENGVEKLVVYVNAAGLPTHAARQVAGGRWASKLGGFVDIEHDSPEDVGPLYGSVALIMERPRGDQNREPSFDVRRLTRRVCETWHRLRARRLIRVNGDGSAGRRRPIGAAMPASCRGIVAVGLGHTRSRCSAPTAGAERLMGCDGSAMSDKSGAWDCAVDKAIVATWPRSRRPPLADSPNLSGRVLRKPLGRSTIAILKSDRPDGLGPDECNGDIWITRPAL